MSSPPSFDDASAQQAGAQTSTPRRHSALPPGRFAAGPLDAITDVAGVRVGHVTLIERERIRTGATAILPHGGNLFQDKVPAALDVLNGYGKFAGATQIAELGELESPVLLTNTLATGRAIEAIHRWTLAQPGNERLVSLNAVVGETNDSRLNDIRAGRPDIGEHLAALEAAAPGAFARGGVGAGTGTVAFGMKGGIGSASRRVRAGAAEYMLGVLVQSNYGGALRIGGVTLPEPAEDKDGSIVIVLATDAPLSSRNLGRLARRCFGGLALTGSSLSNGSGDYALAFSTAPELRRTPEARKNPPALRLLSNDQVSPLFEAAIEATEAAILDSMLSAEDMQGWDAGRGRRSRYTALRLPGG